jgi:LPS-assembly protein
VLEQVNTPDNVTLTATQETRFGVQFQMKGLGSVGSGTSYKLDTQLLPYSRPFNLND